MHKKLVFKMSSLCVQLGMLKLIKRFCALTDHNTEQQKLFPTEINPVANLGGMEGASPQQRYLISNLNHFLKLLR